METDDQSHLDPSKRSVFTFKKNIAEIPCYKDSLLNGIYGGFGGGLLYFLFTSNTRVATHFAVGTFTVVTFGYWSVCRYRYTKLKFELAQISAGLRQKAMYEGTTVEKEMEKKLKD